MQRIPEARFCSPFYLKPQGSLCSLYDQNSILCNGKQNLALNMEDDDFYTHKDRGINTKKLIWGHYVATWVEMPVDS